MLVIDGSADDRPKPEVASMILPRLPGLDGFFATAAGTGLAILLDSWLPGPESLVLSSIAGGVLGSILGWSALHAGRHGDGPDGMRRA